MANPYRHLAALRTALLADATLAALVDVRVGLRDPWGVQDARYPLIAIWQEADVQAVSLPRTNDPCRVRVDAYSKVDADEAAQIYERILLVLHKQEQAINALTSDVCVKEVRQTWNMTPSWDPRLSAWVCPTRFVVRAMTLV